MTKFAFLDNVNQLLMVYRLREDGSVSVIKRNMVVGVHGGDHYNTAEEADAAWAKWLALGFVELSEKEVNERWP